MSGSQLNRTTLVGLALSVSVALFSGCTPVADPQTAPSPSAQHTATSAPATPITPSPTAAPTPTSIGIAGLDGAVIEPGGIGQLRLGLTLAEAQEQGWVAFLEICDRWDASPDLQQRGLSLTFVDDELYEIWVHGSEFATGRGIRNGDGLNTLQRAYGDDLRTELRDGGGGRLPQRFIVEGEHELLFAMLDPGIDDTIKSIVIRTHGTPLIEGC